MLVNRQCLDARAHPLMVNAPGSSGPTDGSTVLSASGTPRRSALAVSLVVAITLNIVAIGVVAAVTAQWRSASGPGQQATWITAVAAAPPASPMATPEVATPRIANPEPKAQASAIEPQRRAEPLPQPPPTEAVAAQAAPDASATGDTAPHRYYRYGEVDQPAMPDSDWNLDTAFLDAAGLRRVVFEVFVDRAGEVVGCTILEPQTLTPQTRDAIENRLRQTTLTPAVRAGVAVASVRTIELSVSTGQ